jgi:hypothetical protein
MQEVSNSSATQGSKGLRRSQETGDNSLASKVEGALSLNENHDEGKVTKAIENQTSKIPSGFYLSLAFGAMAISAGLAATSEKKGLASFVGLWAPSLLLLGIYNKIVKTQGSDTKHSLK